MKDKDVLIRSIEGLEDIPDEVKDLTVGELEELIKLNLSHFGKEPVVKVSGIKLFNALPVAFMIVITFFSFECNLIREMDIPRTYIRIFIVIMVIWCSVVFGKAYKKIFKDD